MATAILEGVETSLYELTRILELEGLGALQGAAEVLKRTAAYDLEFDPDVTVGDLNSRRVLRSARRAASEALIERTRGLLLEGESNTIEFKSSLVADMARKRATRELHAHDALEGECLKTVCALLNSAGGSLLVGVDDTGIPSGGIEDDLKVRTWTRDSWMLHWNSLIKGRFHDGLAVLPFVRSQIVEIDSAVVVLIDVLKRTEPSFVRRSKSANYEFYIRMGPQSESLPLPEFYQFLRARSLDRQRRL